MPAMTGRTVLVTGGTGGIGRASARGLAAEVLERLPRLDVLVNNAGGYWNGRHVTPDGPERTFAVNHLAAFLLTALLPAGWSRAAPPAWSPSPPTPMTCIPAW